VFEMLLPESKRNRKRRHRPLWLKPAVAATLLLVLGFALTAAGSPASALREYNGANTTKSLKDYQQALQKKKDDPRLHFNTGAAAYRNRQYEKPPNNSANP